MAVPTITTVTPSSGLTGGRTLVTITGTNFAQAHTPPTTQGKAPAPNPCVQVLFGSTPSPRAEPISVTQVLAEVPVHDPGAVTVTLKNLDSTGSPITGEVATKANGYTFKLPDLTSVSSIKRIVDAFVLDLRRQVMANVSVAVHTDYAELPDATARIVMMSTLPGIVLIGPTMRENKFYDSNVPDTTDAFPDLSVGYQRPKYTCDLVFSLVAAANHTAEMVNLAAQITDYFTRVSYLEVNRDANDASKGVIRFEVDFDGDAELRTATIEGLSNVRHMTGTVLVRGAWVETEDMVVDRVMPLQDHTPDPGSVEPETLPDVEWTVEQFLSEV